ncbi:hypothetical protein H7T43_14365 [Peribacillus simplex]|nr:hypothetical protein [Peribacillus simplex]
MAARTLLRSVLEETKRHKREHVKKASAKVKANALSTKGRNREKSLASELIKIIYRYFLKLVLCIIEIVIRKDSFFNLGLN